MPQGRDKKKERIDYQVQKRLEETIFPIKTKETRKTRTAEERTMETKMGVQGGRKLEKAPPKDTTEKTHSQLSQKLEHGRRTKYGPSWKE